MPVFSYTEPVKVLFGNLRLSVKDRRLPTNLRNAWLPTYYTVPLTFARGKRIDTAFVDVASLSFQCYGRIPDVR
ncbi:hypothetical protein J6590_090117 [Homalodisca vitripennis]|nr:hypothetical protein J6590_090117 [Homalodisca vitripennis]